MGGMEKLTQSVKHCLYPCSDHILVDNAIVPSIIAFITASTVACKGKISSSLVSLHLSRASED